MALLTYVTYEKLVEVHKITSPDFRLAHILGWCAEILSAGILILDDVVDKGTMRYGLPCWYTLSHVGMDAIMDAFLIEQVVFALIRKNFQHLDCYTNLIELFRDVCLRSAFGKNTDVDCTKRSVNDFNRETYNTTAINKGTYYNFYLPFAMSMYLAG